jgi:predicted Zn finger-like uncharacterized protein
MDLFTRCSHCNTVFRVTTRHLQASGGQVRCGRCEAVFDAFASLTARPPGENKERFGADENQSALAYATTEQAEVEIEVTEAASANATSLPTETEVNGTGGDTPEPEPELTSQRGERVTSDAATNLFEWEFKPAPKLARNGLWLSLSLLMLIGALVQAGYVFRTGILVNVPQARPVYQQVCHWLSCEIGLPRLADQLNIDASDLQLIDPQKPNLVKLTALVRNRARVPVEYPAFELTLTNAREQVVARRVFMPRDYLADTVQTDVGLPGRQELSVNLYLDTGPLRAAGYRIYLFYPS